MNNSVLHHIIFCIFSLRLARSRSAYLSVPCSWALKGFIEGLSASRFSKQGFKLVTLLFRNVRSQKLELLVSEKDVAHHKIHILTAGMKVEHILSFYSHEILNIS